MFAMLMRRAKTCIGRSMTHLLALLLYDRGGIDEIKAHPWFQGVDWAAMLKMEVKPPKLGKCKRGTVNIQPAKPKDARPSAEVQLDDESKELFQTFDFVVRADNGDHDMERIDVCA